MSTTLDAPRVTYDVAPIMGGLYGDGIIGLKGAFTREWVERLREDIEALFADALQRPGGAVGRDAAGRRVVVADEKDAARPRGWPHVSRAARLPERSFGAGPFRSGPGTPI